MKAVSIIFALLFLTTATAARDYISVYNDYCDDSAIISPNTDPAYLKSSRDAIVGLTATTQHIADAINGNGVGGIVSDIGGPIIVMAVLAVLLIITFLVFLCFCCCCDRAGSREGGPVKVLTVLASVFFVGFVGLFVAMIVFIGMMNVRNKASACAVGRLPFDFINGAQAPGVNFIGLQNTTNIVKQASGQLQYAALATPSFTSILLRNLPAQTKAAYQAAGNFYTKYANSTTADGAGSSSRPWSVQSLNPGVNSLIDREFSVYNTTAAQMQTAAIVGIALGSSSAAAPLYQSAMADVTASLDSIIASLKGTFADVTTGTATGIVLSPIGYWIALGFGILVIVFMILILWFVCHMYQGNTDNCRYCGKFLLTLTTFMIAVLALICVALFIASAVVTSACKTVPTVLNSNGVQLVAQLKTWGFNATGDTEKVAKVCVSSDGNGDVGLLVTTSNFTIVRGALDYLDGVLGFKNLVYNNVTREGTASPAINATVYNWTQLSTATFLDQPNAALSLAQLNSQVSCSSTSYALNAVNCSGSGNCVGIFNQNVTSVPSCAPASAQNLLNNLKLYTNSEFALLSQMIADLKSNSGPDTFQQAYRASMANSKTDLGVIVSTVGNWTNSVSSTVGGFYYNANCTIIRQEVFNLEANICFTYANPLYYFTCLLAFVTFFFFLFAWFMCCALRYMPVREETGGATFTQTGDLNAREIAPDMGDGYGTADRELAYGKPDQTRG